MTKYKVDVENWNEELKTLKMDFDSQADAEWMVRYYRLVRKKRAIWWEMKLGDTPKEP